MNGPATLALSPSVFVCAHMQANNDTTGKDNGEGNSGGDEPSHTLLSVSIRPSTAIDTHNESTTVASISALERVRYWCAAADRSGDVQPPLCLACAEGDLEGVRALVDFDYSEWIGREKEQGKKNRDCTLPKYMVFSSEERLEMRNEVRL